MSNLHFYRRLALWSAGVMTANLVFIVWWVISTNGQTTQPSFDWVATIYVGVLGYLWWWAYDLTQRIKRGEER